MILSGAQMAPNLEDRNIVAGTITWRRLSLRVLLAHVIVCRIAHPGWWTGIVCVLGDFSMLNSRQQLVPPARRHHQLEQRPCPNASLTKPTNPFPHIFSPAFVSRVLLLATLLTVLTCAICRSE